MKTIQRFLTKALFVGALIIGVTLSSAITQAQTIGTGPTANAGSDQTLNYPDDSTTLSGSSSGINGIVIYYSWTLISGSATFSSPNSASTFVSRLSTGTNTFRLTATNNTGDTAYDDVNVVVNPQGSVATAYAGPDQTITLPTSSVNLSGSSTGFSGFTPPNYSWVKLQGSGNISSPSQATTSITGLTQGTSVFRLTAADGFDTAYDDVSITVNPQGSGSASVNAGPDQTLYYPTNQTNLSGSSSGINGLVLYYTWTLVSGSGYITSPNTASTTVSSLGLDESVFRLTVTNNTGTTAYDDVMIKVIQSGPSLNIPPTAFAGSDQTIYTPNSTAYLLGNGTDPDGTIAAYSWSKISGSGTISGMTGSGAGDAVTITGLTVGTSVFRLTVTDNEGSTGTDDVTIRVLSSVGCTGTGCGGSGTGGTGGGSGGVSVCPVGTTGTYPNCTISTTNTNPIYFVNTTKLNIRASASASSAKVATVTSRTLLEVLEGNRSSLWVKVKTNTGVTGYVMTRYTQQLVKIGNKASITVRLVNVRSDESLRFKPLRTLKPTDVVDIMYVSPITSWVKVKSADGKTGFVNKYLLKVVQ